MSREALGKTAALLKELDDEELLILIETIHRGWLRQKHRNDMRAVDFETGIANLVQRKVIKKSTYRAVLDRFVLPHKRHLRSPWIIDQMEKLAKEATQTKGQE